jgi:hypothetical protein
VLKTGKDYDYVRNEMDLPRLRAMNAYNKKFPPEEVNLHRIYLMLACFFGVDKDEPEDDIPEEDLPDILETLKAFPQG